MVNLTETLGTLITAAHILHYNSILDAYGHVSVRNPLNNSTFFLSHNVAPALIASPSDLVEYHVSDASPVDPNAPAGYLEREIHASVLRQYSNLSCVIHSHSQEMVAYSLLAGSGPALRPLWHMAGFIGANGAPIFDAAPYYGPNDTQDQLIKTPGLGDALSAFHSTPPSNATKPNPDNLVVLMRGHGFTTAAADIQTAVFQAIYAQGNAQIQTAALGAAASGGNMKTADIKYLSQKEAVDVWATNEQTTARPWGLWKREVEAVGRMNGLYINTLDNGSLTN